MHMQAMNKQQYFPGLGLTLPEKIDMTIETLRLYQPPDRPYSGAFSGGKDSCVIKELSKMAGVNATWTYRVTTMDPPEIIYFIRKQHPDVIFDRPARPLWALIPENGLPMARQRWCCRTYKESKQEAGDRVIIGVRAAESKRRATSWTSAISQRSMKGGVYSLILPILYWTDADVWQFIRERGLPYCSLYDEGFKRLGCVMCPLAQHKMKSDMERWPGIARLWRKGLDLLWEVNTQKPKKVHKEMWKSKDALWDWWTDPKRQTEKAECQTWLFQ